MQKILNISAAHQQWFTDCLAELGYETKTTFYQDLTIAEFFKGGIEDTYNKVCKHWIDNVEFFTEFVMALNWKCNFYYKKNEKLFKIYHDLFYKGQDFFLNHYKDNEEALSYYCRTTD